MGNDKEEYKLKPIEEIVKDDPSWSYEFGTWFNNKKQWSVNSKMLERFRSGKVYEYYTSDKFGFYTHVSGGYYWHESWFDLVGEPIIILNDKDFEL